MINRELLHKQKEICDRIAERLHQSHEPFDLIQELNTCSLLGNPVPKQQAEESTYQAPNSGKQNHGIGIWIPDSDDNNPGYIKNPDVDVIEAGMWADCQYIPPKSSKKRVVFIGESVARGFFLEPHYTPASVLETILNSSIKNNNGCDEFEVIDLARADLGIKDLQYLMEDSLKLEPDCLVLFAGNNWLAYNDLLQKKAAEFAGIISKSGSIIEYRERLKDWVKEQIQSLLQCCLEITEKRNIRIFFVLPEFNLVDYKNDTRHSVPYLKPQDTNRWLKVFGDAKDALQRNDEDEIEAQLLEMTAIDKGSSSIAPSLLAQFYCEQGNADKSEHYYKEARDAELWHWLNTPRCYGFIQDHLRNESSKFNIQLIDLPVIFKNYLNNELPDRRLFFDYCHLTALGIKVSMSSTARQLLSELCDAECCVESLIDEAFDPPSEVLTRAHLLAANHNASWGQPGAIVRHHCGVAAGSNETTYHNLNQWTKIAGIPIPPIMTSAYQKTWDNGDKYVIYRLGTLGPFSYRHLVDNIEFYETKDKHSLSPIKRIRSAHHDAAKKKIDLLQPYSAIRSWEQSEAFCLDKLGYFRSYSLQNEFLFFCSLKKSIHFEITLRLPYAEQMEAPLRILINDAEFIELDVSKYWKRFVFDIEEGIKQEALNSLKIIWPITELNTQNELNRVLGQFISDRRAIFYQPLGDIYQFTANVCI